MARGSDSDVNRAMAALETPSMRYRSFNSPAAPQASQGEGSRAAPAYQPLAQPATDFPLLLAALPEIANVGLPRAPAAPVRDESDDIPVSDRYRSSAPIEPDAGGGGAAGNWREMQLRAAAANAQQYAGPARHAAPFPVDRPFQAAPMPDPPRRSLATSPLATSPLATSPLVSTNTERTRLGAVFQTLLVDKQGLEKSPEVSSGLHTMFSRL